MGAVLILILAILCQQSLEVITLGPQKVSCKGALIRATLGAASTRRDAILFLHFHLVTTFGKKEQSDKGRKKTEIRGRRMIYK